MKTPEEVIESLKKDKLIQNKTYAPSNQDDLAEIIANAWVNCGDDKEAVLKKLQVLTPTPLDINGLLTKENNISMLEEEIASYSQDEIKKARDFIANPIKILEQVELSNLPLAEQENYKIYQNQLQEYQQLLKSYELREKRLEAAKSSFSELEKKIFQKIEDARIGSRVRAKLQEQGVAEKLTLESVDSVNYQFSFAKGNKNAFLNSIKNLPLSGKVLKEFAKGILEKNYDTIVRKIEFDSIIPTNQTLARGTELDYSEQFDKSLRTALVKHLEEKITTDNSTDRCQVSIPREKRNGKVIDPEYSADTIYLNAVIDSIKPVDSAVQQVDSEKIKDIQNQIAALKVKAVELGKRGYQGKKEEIERITRLISKTIYDCQNKGKNPVVEFKNVEESVDNAMTRLNKSLINDLRNLLATVAEWLSLTKSEPVRTNSAMQMSKMKQTLSELFPSSEDDKTPNP